jgi:hypothetical protein
MCQRDYVEAATDEGLAAERPVPELEMGDKLVNFKNCFAAIYAQLTGLA